MPTRKTNPYASLIGSSGTLHFAGIDQGIDFTGAGPVYALDKGTITRVETGGTGWPGQGALVVEKLTSGPAAGSSIYYAEDLTPAAKIALGSDVAKGQPIAYATGSGLAPGIEVGFAQPSGIPVASLPPPRPASQYTEAGAQFLSFVENPPPGPPPSGSATSQAGFGSGITDFFTGLGTPITNLFQGKPTNPVTNTGKIAGGAFEAIGSPFGLNLPKGWLLRGGEIVAGSVLILASILIVGRALSQPVVAAVPARSPDSFKTGQRTGERQARYAAGRREGARRARGTSARREAYESGQAASRATANL